MESNNAEKSKPNVILAKTRITGKPQERETTGRAPI
jgi:hypothetical protein